MSLELFRVLGDPFKPAFKRKLIIWDVPEELEIGFIPKRIYCHPILVDPLATAFKALIQTGKVNELKTWDGCYNPRPIRGYEKAYEKNKGTLKGARYISVHAWGLAIDVNAFENRLGMQPKLTKGFVACFKEQGFKWGGDFSRKDGMHFEYSL